MEREIVSLSTGADCSVRLREVRLRETRFWSSNLGSRSLKTSLYLPYVQKTFGSRN